MSQTSGQVSFRLRVQLEDVEPAVWRTLVVPGEIRLSELHDVLQVAMGWPNTHLHTFTIGGVDYGMQDEDAPDDEMDEATVGVAEVLHGQDPFRYTYDFGDEWLHEILVEGEVRSQESAAPVVCVDGENACPPEDCGGPDVYRELRRVLSDPSHADHERLRRWAGASFDPRVFDLVGVNALLQRLR